MYKLWYLVIWVKTALQVLLFTRNPSTGKKEIFGEYLINAQGEDVVAGTRHLNIFQKI